MVDSDFLNEHVMHIRKTTELISRIFVQNKPTHEYTEAEVIALSTSVMNLYTGFETILRHIIEGKGGRIQKKGSWHKELLIAAVDGKIISNDMKNQLLKYLAFRHFQVHGYGYMMDLDEFRHLTEGAEETVDAFFSELKTGNYLLS